MTTSSTLTLDDNDPLVINARQAEERLYAAYQISAKTHYFTLPHLAIRVRVTEIGSGPPLLVVPGNTGDVFPLASLVSGLKGRRIIAINRPGGGLSEGMDHREVDIRQFAVETLTAVLDEMKIDHTDVVAHSMGAHWSLWLAMDRPERVRRLVTLGNPGNVMKGAAPLALRLAMKPPFSWILGRLLTGGPRKDALRSLKMMGHGDETLHAMPTALGDCYFHFRRLPHYRISLTSLMQNAPRPITAEDLAKITHPVALLWGTKDNFATVEVGQSIADALPLGELHSLSNAGHLPWLDYPQTCAEIIDEFLNRASRESDLIVVDQVGLHRSGSGDAARC